MHKLFQYLLSFHQWPPANSVKKKMLRRQSFFCCFSNGIHKEVQDISHRVGSQSGRMSSISTNVLTHPGRPTQRAAADVQQWVPATYFNVSRLGCWLHVLAELIGESLVAATFLSVLGVVLLIGLWPQRTRRVGLQLLDIARDLHLPL